MHSQFQEIQSVVGWFQPWQKDMMEQSHSVLGDQGTEQRNSTREKG